MKIIINSNVNTITIDNITMGCYHPVHLSKILDEIFNRLNSSGVELILINEDKRQLIGEW